MTRCKYCYRTGHTDANCRQKAMKRPPSMPERVSKAQYNKCKKKGHLSFNCSPKYDNKPIKSKSDRRQKFRNNNKKESANVCEFAGTTLHYDPHHLTYFTEMN